MVLTQSLLGISGYGMLSLVMSFQWILILIAIAGLPPAIAKYVSEYLAKEDKYMVKQIIKSSFKIMVSMSIIFTVVFFLLAKPLADYFHGGPELVILFQAVSFIAPFSVVLGLFRGVFQGYQRMTDIMITRIFEQVFMIGLAVVFIKIGFYVLGAVLGTLVGFAIASASALLIFKYYLWDGLKDAKIPEIPVNESKLIKKLLIFSSPIIVTGLAELTLFQAGNFVIPLHLGFAQLGYYNIASPIARLPLVISTSVAMALLPAASEALALKGNNLVRKYVIYRLQILVNRSSSHLCISYYIRKANYAPFILESPSSLQLFRHCHEYSGNWYGIFLNLWNICKCATGSRKTLPCHVLLGNRNSNKFGFNNIISTYIWFEWSSNCYYDCFVYGNDSYNSDNYASY